MSLFIKSTKDDRTVISDETASSVFDSADNQFDIFSFMGSGLEDRTFLEEYQCFKHFLNEALFGECEEESMDFSERVTYEEFMNDLCQRESSEEVRKSKMPGLHSKSHKISKPESQNTRKSKKHWLVVSKWDTRFPSFSHRSWDFILQSWEKKRGGSIILSFITNDILSSKICKLWEAWKRERCSGAKLFVPESVVYFFFICCEFFSKLLYIIRFYRYSICLVKPV